TYSQEFPAEEIHIVPSATITKSPIDALKAALALGRGLLASRRLVRRLKPAVAVGFGGYPTLPPMVAAFRAGVPTVIHDANAVLGRANRYLAPKVTAVATSFPRVGGAEIAARKTVETGNPVRPPVLAAAKTPYPARQAHDPFVLLVFGGSQGARFMSDLVPPAARLLSEAHRRCLRIVQQCRPEDVERT